MRLSSLYILEYAIPFILILQAAPVHAQSPGDSCSFSSWTTGETRCSFLTSSPDELPITIKCHNIDWFSFRWRPHLCCSRCTRTTAASSGKRTTLCFGEQRFTNDTRCVATVPPPRQSCKWGGKLPPLLGDDGQGKTASCKESILSLGLNRDPCDSLPYDFRLVVSPVEDPEDSKAVHLKKYDNEMAWLVLGNDSKDGKGKKGQPRFRLLNHTVWEVKSKDKDKDGHRHHHQTTTTGRGLSGSYSNGKLNCLFVDEYKRYRGYWNARPICDKDGRRRIVLRPADNDEGLWAWMKNKQGIYIGPESEADHYSSKPKRINLVVERLDG